MAGQIGETGQFDHEEWPISSTEGARYALEMRERSGQNRDRAGSEAVISVEQSRKMLEKFLFAWWTVLPAGLLMFALIVVAYAMKSWLHIDLFDGHAPMHSLLFT